MAARLYFCESERKIPSLCRGWRTPDPSPTRDAAGLPGCSVNLCIAEPFEDDDSSPRGLSMASHWSSRTPSPPLMRPQLATPPIGSDAIIDDKLSAMQSPQSSPGPSTPRSNSGEKGGAVMTQPPTPHQELRHGTLVASFAAGVEKKSQAKEGKKNPAPHKSSDGCLPTVSVGTVGHPHSCAEPCKYAMKKRRGCKDGSACTRCHLCKWKKRGANKEAAAFSAPPEPHTVVYLPSLELQNAAFSEPSEPENDVRTAPLDPPI